LSATTPLDRGGRGSNGLLTIDGDVQINGTISSTGTTIGGGSSSVDWSDITNAPSIPSFSGYSETDEDILIDADNDITISAGHDIKLSANYSITADKEITTSSDERLKNIKSLLNPDIAEIAKTRIVSY
jgi:hypothetical protein